jgi:cation:H+ antiporter
VSLALALALVGVGILLLGGGGELLVRGAISLARIARVPPAVIGLTIVAMGTSLPELVVSLVAGVGGQPDVAVGNVVGSNIFNVGVIVGFAALLLPLTVRGNAVRLEWPFMFVTSFLALLLARDGLVDRLEGGFFTVSLAFFTTYVVRLARTQVRAEEARALEREVDALSARGRMRGAVVDLGLVAIGLAVLVVGARVLVGGAVAIAEQAGASERVIGLTIVAGGTSLPELATSAVAAARRQADIALANVIGSNIFNILGILGVAALVRPVSVAPALVTSDMWWMLAFSLVLLPMMLRGMRISRREGATLLAGYGVYLWLLVSSSDG